MARAAKLAMALIAAAVLAFPAKGAEKLSAATEQLFDAVWSDDLAAVRGAITGGADVSAVNEFGVRAVDMAVDKGHYDIAHYLLSVDQLRRDTEGTNGASAEPTPRQRVEQRTVTTASLAPAPVNPPTDPPKAGAGTSAGWLIAAETPAPTTQVAQPPNIVAHATPDAPAPKPAPPVKSAAETLWSPGGTGESNAAPKLRVASVAEPRQITPTPEPVPEPEKPVAKVESPAAATAATVKLGAEESATETGASGWLGRITEALNISKLTGTENTDAASKAAPETTKEVSAGPVAEAVATPDPASTLKFAPEPTPTPAPASPPASTTDPQPADDAPDLLDTLSNLFSPDADVRTPSRAEAATPSGAQSSVPEPKSPAAITASPSQSAVPTGSSDVALEPDPAPDPDPDPDPDPEPVATVEPLAGAPEPVPVAEKPSLFDTIGKLFAQDTSAEPSSELASSESVAVTTASEPVPAVTAQSAAAAPHPETTPVFEPSGNIFGDDSGVKVAEVATPRTLEAPPPLAAEVSESTAAATPVDPPAVAPVDPAPAEPAPNLLDTISNLFRAESGAEAVPETTPEATPEVVPNPAPEAVAETKGETTDVEVKAPPPSATWTELSSYPLAPNAPIVAETTSSETALAEPSSTETTSSSAVPTEETNQINETPVVTDEQPGLIDAIGDLFRSEGVVEAAPETTPELTPDVSSDGLPKAVSQSTVETAAITEDSAPVAAETVSPPKIGEPATAPETVPKSAEESTRETAPEVAPATASESTSAINQQPEADEQPGLLDAIGNLFRTDSAAQSVEAASVETAPAPTAAEPASSGPELFTKSANLFRSEGGVKIAEVAEPVSVPSPSDSQPVQPAAASEPASQTQPISNPEPVSEVIADPVVTKATEVAAVADTPTNAPAEIISEEKPGVFDRLSNWCSSATENADAQPQSAPQAQSQAQTQPEPQPEAPAQVADAPAPKPAPPVKSAAETLWSPGGTGESNAAPKLRVASVAEPRQITPTPEPVPEPEKPVAKVESPAAATAATVKLGAEESATETGASGWLGRITEALNISKLTGTENTDAASKAAPETTKEVSAGPVAEAVATPDPASTLKFAPEPTPTPAPASPPASTTDPQPADDAPDLLDTLSNLFSPDADVRTPSRAEAATPSGAQSSVPEPKSPAAITASPSQSAVPTGSSDVALEPDPAPDPDPDPDPDPEPVATVEPLAGAPEPVPVAEKPSLFDTIGKLFAQDTSAEPSSELASSESVAVTTASEPVPAVTAQSAAAAPHPETTPVFEPSGNIFGDDSGVKVAEVATPRTLEAPPPLAAEVSESTAAATPVDPPAVAPVDPAPAEPAPNLLDTISNLFRAESGAEAVPETTPEATPEVVPNPAPEAVAETKGETTDVEVKAPPPSATWTELSSYPLAPNAPIVAETTSSETALAEPSSTETTSSSAVPTEETNQINETPVVTDEQPGLIDAIGDLFRSEGVVEAAPETTPELTPDVSSDGLPKAVSQSTVETAAITEDSAPVAAETVSPPKIGEPATAPETVPKSAEESTRETAPEVAPATASESTSAINQQPEADEQPGLLDAIGNLFRTDSAAQSVEAASVETAPAPTAAEPASSGPELFTKSANLFRSEGGVKIAEVAEPVSVPSPSDSQPVQPAAASEPASQTQPISNPEPVSEVIADPVVTKATEVAAVADTPTNAPAEIISEEKPGVFDRLSNWCSSATENADAQPQSAPQAQSQAQTQPEPQPEAPAQVADAPAPNRAASDQTIVQTADQAAAADRVRKVAPPPEPRQKPFTPPVQDRLSTPPPSVAERPQIPLPGPIDANPVTRPANAAKSAQFASAPPKLVPTGPDEVGKRRARAANAGPILSNPARPPAPMLAAAPLSGVELKLGSATKLGAVLPATGPRRDLCVDKSHWNTMFCVEPVAWPAAMGAAFHVSTTYYRGQQAIVQYEAGRATQYHALFPVKGMKKITEHFRKLYGPPTEIPEIWTALIGQPQRPNRTLRWRSNNPKTGAEHILEIREIDDLRWSSPPDVHHGVVRLYARDKGSVFELLSATDLLLVHIRRRS